MAKANRHAIFHLLSDALRQNKSLSLADFLEASSFLKLDDDPRWEEVRGLLYSRTSPSEEEIRDLADYLSVLYDRLTKRAQDFLLERLKLVDPELAWERDVIEEDDQPTDRWGDYRGSAGPDLLRPVAFETFQNLLYTILRRGNYLDHARNRRFDSEILEEVADDPNKRRTLYWSLRLFSELSERSTRIARQIPAFWQFAVGFLNPITEVDSFGVIALAMGESDAVGELPEFIHVENNNFPVLVRSITLGEHIAPKQHPSNGTAACWAKTRINSSKPKMGVLTAKHVTGIKNGARVNFGNGSGAVIDVAPDGIDAALVSTPESFAQNSMQPMRAIRTIAPWTSVEFTGAVTGPHLTLVTATTDQLGILNSPLFPIRVLLDKHGGPGDSGALVVEKTGNSRKAVGLYMGEYVDQAGRSGGLAQHMEQIVEIMDMEIYQ